MTPEELFLRRAVVFASALVYWVGVWVQARRIRRHIGHSPNVRPRGTKEKLLWAGWIFVVAVWLFQPLFIRSESATLLVRLSLALLSWPAMVLGLLLVAAGYAGTLWCYVAMGDAWRMGINLKEKNNLVSSGPYHFIRHPIYAFQVVMLAGASLLLPTLLSFAILVLHLICALIKMVDEENYLKTVHGQTYIDYMARTGRLMPKLFL